MSWRRLDKLVRWSFASTEAWLFSLGLRERRWTSFEPNWKKSNTRSIPGRNVTKSLVLLIPDRINDGNWPTYSKRSHRSFGTSAESDTISEIKTWNVFYLNTETWSSPNGHYKYFLFTLLEPYKLINKKWRLVVHWLHFMKPWNHMSKLLSRLTLLYGYIFNKIF